MNSRNRPSCSSLIMLSSLCHFLHQIANARTGPCIWALDCIVLHTLRWYGSQISVSTMLHRMWSSLCDDGLRWRRMPAAIAVSISAYRKLCVVRSLSVHRQKSLRDVVLRVLCTCVLSSIRVARLRMLCVHCPGRHVRQMQC